MGQFKQKKRKKYRVYRLGVSNLKNDHFYLKFLDFPMTNYIIILFVLPA